MAETFGWSPEERKLAILSVTRVHILEDGLEPTEVRRGTQMGMPLSFPILCVLNAFAASQGTPDWCVHGDDLLMIAEDDEYKAVTDSHRNLGFVINERKSWRSRHGGVFAGSFYRRTNASELEAVSTIKLSSLMPFTNKSLVEAATQVKGLTAAATEMATRHLLRVHVTEVRLRKEYNLPLVGPAWLGCGGLPESRFRSLDKTSAAIAGTSYSTKKKRRKVDIDQHDADHSWVQKTYGRLEFLVSRPRKGPSRDLATETEEFITWTRTDAVWRTIPPKGYVSTKEVDTYLGPVLAVRARELDTDKRPVSYTHKLKASLKRASTLRTALMVTALAYNDLRRAIAAGKRRCTKTTLNEYVPIEVVTLVEEFLSEHDHR
jgi:hypothetical protein